MAQATHEDHLKRQKLVIGGNRESSLRSFKLTKVWFTLDVNDSETIASVLRCQGAIISEDVGEASVVIADDPTRLPLAARFVLVIAGGWAISPTYAKSNGLHGGISIKYNAAAMGKRLFWMSEDAIAKWPVEAKIIGRLIRRPECQWVTLATRQDFLDAVTARTRGRKRVHRVYEAIALVTKVEKGLSMLKDVKSAFTSSEFLKFFRRPDQVSSTMGMCSY